MCFRGTGIAITALNRTRWDWTESIPSSIHRQGLSMRDEEALDFSYLHKCRSKRGCLDCPWRGSYHVPCLCERVGFSIPHWALLATADGGGSCGMSSHASFHPSVPSVYRVRSIRGDRDARLTLEVGGRMVCALSRRQSEIPICIWEAAYG